MKQSSDKNERLWTGRFLLLLAVTLLNGAAGQMTLPLVSKYALSLGADLTLASTVAGLMSIVSLVVCPFAGALADRVSRKWILVFANLGYGLCLFGHAFCRDVSSLIVCRLLTGIFFSVCSVTNVAFSSTFIARKRMGEGLGYVALATIVAQAAGPSVSLWLLDVKGYTMTFLVAGLSCLLCMAVILCMPYVHQESGERRKVVLKDLYAKEFTCFMLMAFLFSSGNGLVSTYIKLIAEERSIANISLFFTMYSVCLIILRPLTGKFLDRKGVYVVLIPSFICAAAGMAVIGFAGTIGGMLLASFFKAMGQGCGTPSLQAYCVKKLDKKRAGVATSTIMIGQNVGNALAPILGSYAVLSVGYRGMFAGAAIIIFAAGLLLLLIQSRLDKKKAS